MGKCTPAKITETRKDSWYIRNGWRALHKWTRFAGLKCSGMFIFEKLIRLWQPLFYFFKTQLLNGNDKHTRVSFSWLQLWLRCSQGLQGSYKQCMAILPTDFIYLRGKWTTNILLLCNRTLYARAHRFQGWFRNQLVFVSRLKCR